MADEAKANNVVLFPGVTKNRPPQSLEEICRVVELAKTTRIEEVVEIVFIELIEHLYGHSYDFADRPDTNKDMAFVIEALKSILQKHDGLEHPFQKVAETYFYADANGDLSMVEADEIEIEFVPEDAVIILPDSGETNGE